MPKAEGLKLKLCEYTTNVTELFTEFNKEIAAISYKQTALALGFEL